MFASFVAVRSSARGCLACVFVSSAIAPLFALPKLVGAAEQAAKFAVAAQDETAARAALGVLEQGGSAVDAAVAGSAMLGVTASVSCGLGGGGFTLLYD